jgi:hypothetical protein
VTDQLRRLLDDAAAEAHNYADAAGALGTARRHRRARRLVAVPLAAALAVVAAVAVPTLLKPDERRQAPAASTYPSTVTPPEHAPALPSGRVGAASFLYAPCLRNCDPLLVVPAGRSTP